MDTNAEIQRPIKKYTNLSANNKNNEHYAHEKFNINIKCIFIINFIALSFGHTKTSI